MTIDINELREAIQTFGSQAINEGDLNELLDRLELTESREAVYKKAFEISENTSRDLTVKVIPNIRNQLEASEKGIALREKIMDAYGITLNTVMNERDAAELMSLTLRTEIDRLKVENATYIKTLLEIADWDGVWGPFPETNERWRGMAVVRAREATKSFKHGEY